MSSCFKCGASPWADSGAQDLDRVGAGRGARDLDMGMAVGHRGREVGRGFAFAGPGGLVDVAVGCDGSRFGLVPPAPIVPVGLHVVTGFVERRVRNPVRIGDQVDNLMVELADLVQVGLDLVGAKSLGQLARDFLHALPFLFWSDLRGCGLVTALARRHRQQPRRLFKGLVVLDLREPRHLGIDEALQRFRDSGSSENGNG